MMHASRRYCAESDVRGIAAIARLNSAFRRFPFTEITWPASRASKAGVGIALASNPEAGGSPHRLRVNILPDWVVEGHVPLKRALAEFHVGSVFADNFWFELDLE